MLLLREVSANRTDGHAVKKPPEIAQMFGQHAGASIRSRFIVCNDSQPAPLYCATVFLFICGSHAHGGVIPRANKQVSFGAGGRQS